MKKRTLAIILALSLAFGGCPVGADAASVSDDVALLQVTNPEVTNPEVTNPEVTKPEVTKPEVTKPEVTKPEVTKPEVKPEVKPDPKPVVKKDATITWDVKTTTKTYDGKAINAKATSTSDGAVTVTYYSDDKATKSIAAPKNAGTYYAKAVVAATEKFNAASSVQKVVINKAASKVTVSTTYAYTGKAVKVKATVKGSNGKVTYKFYKDSKGKKKIATPKKIGTYYVKASVAASKNYKAASSKITKIKIVKPVAQKITAKNVSKSFKAKDLKKKAKTFKVTAKAKGAVSFKKASGSKAITVAKTGKVTVKKGTKKGTYTVKVKVSAAASGKYKAATKTVTVKVKVK